MTMSYIGAALLGSYNSAFPRRRVRHFFSTSMKRSVGITSPQGAWTERFFGKDFTSLPWLEMQHK
jgi:hypothetical protein